MKKKRAVADQFATYMILTRSLRDDIAFELSENDPGSVRWPYCAKLSGYPAWVRTGDWIPWVEHSGIMVTCVGTSFYFRSKEDRMQFVMAWS